MLALLDPGEARHLVDRVLARIRHDATGYEYFVQYELARPVVAAMMRAGDLDGALEVAAMLSTAYSMRADALLEIAAALLRDGDVARAKVGAVLPEVVRAVGAEVISGTRRVPAPPSPPMFGMIGT